MPITFSSNRQKNIFDAVIRGIERLGYGGKLCQHGYEFSDWFGGTNERIQVPAATFARHPADYNSACLAIFLESGGVPPLQFRSLGAPFGIEVQEDGIVPWTIGHDEKTTRAPVGRIPADAMDRFFSTIQSKWRPSDVLRAKNIGSGATMSEIDWIDQALIAAFSSAHSRFILVHRGQPLRAFPARCPSNPHTQHIKSRRPAPAVAGRKHRRLPSRKPTQALSTGKVAKSGRIGQKPFSKAT